MQRYRGAAALRAQSGDPPAGGDPGGPLDRSVVTIGAFDGVHLGHQQLLARTVEHARALRVPAVALTFDPHPAAVLRGAPPPVLTLPRRKAELIDAAGVDVLVLEPFTPVLRAQSPEAFVRSVLVDVLHARHVVVGANFRFGARAAGDVSLLRRLGAAAGFTVDDVSLEVDGGEEISSTRIRSLVAEGDVGRAANLLGRPHRVEGVVVRGDARGRELGYPTANLATAAHAAVPADGVYAGFLVRRRGARLDLPLPAAISVGTNPTFDGAHRRVEAYVLDFAGDLYGEYVAFDFVAWLRGTERFAGVDALVAQMARDVERTREVLRTG